jgi:hypothetical protein
MPNLPDQPDLEALHGLVAAIEANERATVAILHTVLSLKAKPWFIRWCEEHGIAPNQATSTSKLARDIRAVLAGTERPR